MSWSSIDGRRDGRVTADNAAESIQALIRRYTKDYRSYRTGSDEKKQTVLPALRLTESGSLLLYRLSVAKKKVVGFSGKAGDNEHTKIVPHEKFVPLLLRTEELRLFVGEDKKSRSQYTLYMDSKTLADALLIMPNEIVDTRIGFAFTVMGKTDYRVTNFVLPNHKYFTITGAGHQGHLVRVEQASEDELVLKRRSESDFPISFRFAGTVSTRV